MLSKADLIVYKKMNMIDNKKVMLWLNLGYFILLPIFLVLFWKLSVLLIHSANSTMSFAVFPHLIGILFIIFLLLPLHEGIHGLFFKLFNQQGKVKFGFKNGACYATSPNSLYTKPAFSWICLAPFTLISLLLTIMYILNLISQPAYILLAAFHASSCIGDFYWILTLIRSPKKCIVEDTEVGLSLYLRQYKHKK